MSSGGDYPRKRAREEEKTGQKNDENIKIENHSPATATSGAPGPTRGGADRGSQPPFPPPPPGYYPPHGYFPPPPPPPGEGGQPYPMPQRGYEGYQGPYMHPPPPGYPPYMPPPYGMYPPYPHHMYGPPPPHGPPGHYYQDPHAPPSADGRYGGEEGGYGPPGQSSASAPSGRSGQRGDSEGDERKMSSRGGPEHRHLPPPSQQQQPPPGPPPHQPPNFAYHHPDVGVDSEEHDDEGSDPNNNVSTRLKTYIKPRIPSTQDVLDRRARKNAQSRARAAKLRQRIADIEQKLESDRTEEEVHIYQQYENRRKRKNDRSRERALEKKEEIDRILAKPTKKRTKIEKQFMETALSAKKRKNEGDRLRRQRLKELGLSSKGTAGLKPGISARGPLPPQYQQQQPGGNQGYAPPHGGGMGEIPMSPLPTMPPHHPHHPHHPSYPYHHPMQSPGFGSPGMMSSMGYPSPHRRGPPMTPGRHDHMPYMPPPQAYDQQSPTANRQPNLQSRVEHRRNPDGSTSIQIGGQGSADTEGDRGVDNADENDENPTREGSPFGGDAQMLDEQGNASDVSKILAENAANDSNDDDDDEHDDKSANDKSIHDDDDNVDDASDNVREKAV